MRAVQKSACDDRASLGRCKSPEKRNLRRAAGAAEMAGRAIVAEAVNRLQTKPGKTRPMIMVKAILL
jgi:hypothetical protein